MRNRRAFRAPSYGRARSAATARLAEARQKRRGGRRRAVSERGARRSADGRLPPVATPRGSYGEAGADVARGTVNARAGHALRMGRGGFRTTLRQYARQRNARSPCGAGRHR